MTENNANTKWWSGVVVAVGIFLVAALVGFAYALSPVSSSATAELKEVRITSGESARDIASRLRSAGVVRSEFTFRIYAVVTGNAGSLKPGRYLLSPASSSREIIEALVEGPREIEVRIPEGATSFEIDGILAERGILLRGTFTAHIRAQSRPVEGRLFSDTYRFLAGTEPRDVLEKLLANFSAKVGALLALSKDPERDLVLASLLEKEVPEYEDRRVVAGVLLKRQKAGMPLQADATVCYAKEIAAGEAANCLPLSRADFKIDSPYNTYLYQGFPPGPIGNPGIEALKAAMNPASSPYWYYLSDPDTKRTIFSKTFDEHLDNQARYLR